MNTWDEIAKSCHINKSSSQYKAVLNNFKGTGSQVIRVKERKLWDLKSGSLGPVSPHKIIPTSHPESWSHLHFGAFRL